MLAKAVALWFWELLGLRIEVRKGCSSLQNLLVLTRDLISLSKTAFSNRRCPASNATSFLDSGQGSKWYSLYLALDVRAWKVDN